MSYKYLFFFLLIQLVCTLGIKAQKLDSLLREINNYKKEDTIRLNLLLATGIEYQKSNPDKGIIVTDSAINLAKKINATEKLAYAYGIKASNYFLLTDYSEALELYQLSLRLYEELGIKKGIAAAYNNMGNLYVTWGQYYKALDYYEKALHLFRELNLRKYELMPLGNMAIIYKDLSDIPKALEYAQKSVDIAESLNDLLNLAKCYNTLGNIYSDLGDFKSSIKYYEKSYDISRQINNKRGEATTLQLMGSQFISMSDYDKALNYLMKSREISEQAGYKDLTMHGLVHIGQAYINLGDYGNAMKYLEKAVPLATTQGNKRLEAAIKAKLGTCLTSAPDTVLQKNNIIISERYNRASDFENQAVKIGKDIGSLELQRDGYCNLSIINSAKNDHIKALEDYKKYIMIRDSIFNDEKRQEIQRISMQNVFDKKKDSLSLQQQITDGKLNQQILLAKQQQQQLELINKEKDLQKLAYLKTQADLQNEQLQKREKEKQLILAEKEKELQSVQVTTLSQENDLSKLKRHQQWFYSIAVFVLLGLLSSYFFYRNRLKQGSLKMELAKEKAEQEKKEAEFQRSLADVSLTALRSQMNPHFIFNCLNSIKLYTTQNDTYAASEYLTKFSRLIRLVMENSRNDRISLTAELEALRLYIEMEAMRFKEKLSYSISVNEDVEMDYIEIPPLLLQPYVENAIWHGLMHKEEGGRIDITAAMKKDESLLEINIADNGVGRSKAEELRSKTATKHKSYGMKVTSERITLINQIYKTGASVAIHDITNDNGEIAGTRVVIQIPV